MVNEPPLLPESMTRQNGSSTHGINTIVNALYRNDSTPTPPPFFHPFYSPIQDGKKEMEYQVRRFECTLPASASQTLGVWYCM